MSNAQSPRPKAPRHAPALPSPPSVPKLVTTASSQVSSPPRLSSTPTPASPTIAPTREREQARSVVEVAVEDAVAPLCREIGAIRARLEELETRSASVPPSAPPVTPSPTAPPPAWTAAQSAAPLAVAFPPSVISIEHELRAVDGTRRRRRTVAALGFVLFLVFGGLLGAMALSYA
jgi:hypothetical protein